MINDLSCRHDQTITTDDEPNSSPLCNTIEESSPVTNTHYLINEYHNTVLQVNNESSNSFSTDSSMNLGQDSLEETNINHVSPDPTKMNILSWKLVSKHSYSVMIL